MNEDLIKKLKSLCQMDIDAVNGYEQAIKRIEHPTIHQQMSKFQDDHKRHIERLSDFIRLAGGEPPERKPDFKGYLLEGFTSLRSSSGTEGAMKAMHSNEKMTNKKYSEALDWDIEADVRVFIEEGLGDEKRHLSYITETIEAKSWEKHHTQA